MTGGYGTVSASAPGGPARTFAARVRQRQPTVGYWIILDSPVSTERIARLGYDYVAFDAQHGLFGYQGMVNGLLAVDAAGSAAGVVRVGANDQFQIGRALDAGASAVIVPLVDNAAQAAAAVSYTTYPPNGVRSYGPMRSALRIGPDPAAVRDQVACLVMIETAEGLANVEAICQVPGLAGIYIGPSDLTIALGGASSTDPSRADEFEAALTRIREAAESAGVAAGIHTANGDDAARRLAEGFTFVSVSSDLTHLEIAARNHLLAVRGQR